MGEETQSEVGTGVGAGGGGSEEVEEATSLICKLGEWGQKNQEAFVSVSLFSVDSFLLPGFVLCPSPLFLSSLFPLPLHNYLHVNI